MNTTNIQTHRDYFAGLENNVTLTKFKQFRVLFHPELPLHGAKTAEWKKQKKEMELLRSVYGGIRTLTSLSETERAELSVYSENLNVLFITDPCDFNFRDL